MDILKKYPIFCETYNIPLLLIPFIIFVLCNIKGFMNLKDLNTKTSEEKIETLRGLILFPILLVILILEFMGIISYN